MDECFLEPFNLSSRANISCCLASYNINCYHDDLYSLYNVSLPDTFLSLVKSRKADFLAGRYVALQALKKFTNDTVIIKTNNNRSPRWPDGIVGSISHSKDWAVCICSLKEEYCSIGVDLEPLI